MTTTEIILVSISTVSIAVNVIQHFNSKSAINKWRSMYVTSDVKVRSLSQRIDLLQKQMMKGAVITTSAKNEQPAPQPAPPATGIGKPKRF